MNSVVYFPNLEPPATWAKEAALCWDWVDLPAPPTTAGKSLDWYLQSSPLYELCAAIPNFLRSVPWEYLSPEVERRFLRWLAENPPANTPDEPRWMLFDEKFRPDNELLSGLVELGLVEVPLQVEDSPWDAPSCESRERLR